MELAQRCSDNVGPTASRSEILYMQWNAILASKHTEKNIILIVSVGSELLSKKDKYPLSLFSKLKPSCSVWHLSKC